MKRTSILAALIATVMFTQLGCGDPALGKLQTLQLNTTTTNLVGIGGKAQLSVTGTYTSTDAKDLSTKVTYVITPTGTDVNGAALMASPNTVTISSTGLLTAVDPAVCTWGAAGASGSTTPAGWFLTGSYQIVATFQGITSQPVFVGVASAIGSNAGNNNPNLLCGPS
ncbi:MAG TPA: hypothetical protein VJO35_01115 [Terriglobales bacterium]|nr:hypothetical protein [Terriglobales bacterium]